MRSSRAILGIVKGPGPCVGQGEKGESGKGANCPSPFGNLDRLFFAGAGHSRDVHEHGKSGLD